VCVGEIISFPWFSKELKNDLSKNNYLRGVILILLVCESIFVGWGSPFVIVLVPRYKLSLCHTPIKPNLLSFLGNDVFACGLHDHVITRFASLRLEEHWFRLEITNWLLFGPKLIENKQLWKWWKWLKPQSNISNMRIIYWKKHNQQKQNKFWKITQNRSVTARQNPILEPISNAIQMTSNLTYSIRIPRKQRISVYRLLYYV
jgi:hypothetical protein